MSQNNEAEIKELTPELNSDIKRLVDWKNPPTLSDLKSDYQEAIHSHREMVSRVNTWLEALRGTKDFKTMEGRSEIQPRLIRKQAEWRYAGLEEPFLSTADMFKVHPATYDDVKSARQNELVLNKQFRVDINRIEFINKYIRNAVNHGTAICKLGWETETGIVTEEVPVYTKTLEETMIVLQQMVQQGQLPPEQAQQLAMSGQPIQIGLEPQEIETLVVNRPVIEVKDCRDVIIDPSCEGDINKAQFIIDIFTTDMSTLKKDGRYSNLELLEQRQENETIDDFYYDDNSKQDHYFRFKDLPRKKLIAYEYWGYWDIDGDGIVKPIIATWINDTIIRLEENPYPDKKLPFVLVQYLPPDRNTVYGDADASLLLDNQKVIGAVTRAIIDLIGRSANAQRGIRKDLLDPINKKKFNQGLDFEYNPINADPNTAFYMTKMPEVPRSALEIIQFMSNEAEALTGIKAFSQGLQSQALGDSVGGIRSALDATSKRELGILRRLADGLKDIGKKIIAMNSVWLDDEEIIRITDDDFVAIKRSDLAGNFDLVVDISTAEADNQKASELSFMLQTLGNSVPFDITKMILCKIADLRKLPDLAKAIEEFQPQPDPLQQEAVQLQNEMLKAQITNEQAKGAENQTDVELKRAKTQTELAKAKVASASADMTNLNFLEQSSGLQHERELEKLDRKNEADIFKQQMKTQNDKEIAQQKAEHEILKQNNKAQNDLGLQKNKAEIDLGLQRSKAENDLGLQNSKNQYDLAKTGLQLQRGLEEQLLGFKFKDRLNKETRYNKNRR